MIKENAVQPILFLLKMLIKKHYSSIHIVVINSTFICVFRRKTEEIQQFLEKNIVSHFPRRKLFLQDGDSLQNSAKYRTSWDKVGAQKLTILARSSNLNSIENTFHIVKRKLHYDALELPISREDVESFEAPQKSIKIKNFSCNSWISKG